MARSTDRPDGSEPMTAEDAPERTGSPSGSPQRGPAIRAVPVRHPWRWVLAAILAVLVAMLVHTLVFSQTEQPNQTGSRYGWDIVGQYLFSSKIIGGAVVTVELTVVAMLAGLVIGVTMAVMRMSKSRLLSSVAWAYIWFFRGTPVLVQLIFWFNIAALYPQLSLGIPFGPSFVTLDINSILTPFVAGALALSLNEGAYMSEIVRAGLLSVDEGQAEAASALGLSRAATLRRIVLPQAMRLIIPPTGNETISMLKTSSLVSVIAVVDLLKGAQDIANANYRIIQLLIVASIWYLFMTSLLSIGQYYLERHYARGSSRSLPETPLQRLRQDIRHLRPKRPRPEERPADGGPDASPDVSNGASHA